MITNRVTDLPKSKLIDRRRLMEEYGFTGATADRIIRDARVHTFHYPGERKTYIVRADVDRIVAEFTFDKTRVRRAG